MSDWISIGEPTFQLTPLQDEIVKLSKMKADIQSWMEEHS